MKPNVGHSEGASGLTSVIKAVLALENKTIPPNIKFNEPNPQSKIPEVCVHQGKLTCEVPFREASLIVPTTPIPWPTDRKERVSVNSFGLGGSNAHVSTDFPFL